MTCFGEEIPRSQTSLDAVLAEFQGHMADLTNAEAAYTYDGHTNVRLSESDQQLSKFTGHWLYAAGREVVDFRADPEALLHLGQGDETKAFRLSSTQNIYLFDSRKNVTIFYNPLEHRAVVQRGREVRGWPPSIFLERVPPLGEKLIDLIKGNKTARLVAGSGQAGEPIVISFHEPHNDWMEYAVSFAPSMGYRTVRREISIDKGERTMVDDITPILTNGVWFPAKVSYTDKSRDEKINVRVEWACREIHVNAPVFDIARLKVTLPKGTTVRRGINGPSETLPADEDAWSLMDSFTK